MELLVCARSGFHSFFPLPCPIAALPAFTDCSHVYSLCYCCASTRAVVINNGTQTSVHAHPHCSALLALSVIEQFSYCPFVELHNERETEVTKHLLENAQNTDYTRVLKHIDTVTTQTWMLEMARHGIGIRTRYQYQCRSKLSVLEVLVQSGISLSLSLTHWKLVKQVTVRKLSVNVHLCQM